MVKLETRGCGWKSNKKLPTLNSKTLCTLVHFRHFSHFRPLVCDFSATCGEVGALLVRPLRLARGGVSV
jgi:hypothetical protein